MKEFNIDDLLNKYFEGETTLEEEKYLRNYFLYQDLPKKYKKYSGIFRHIAEESKEELSNEFDENLKVKFYSNDIHKTKVIYKIGYAITAVAAVAAILIMAYIQFLSLPNKSLRFNYLSNDTYKDPKIAYAETEKTLLYISVEMNKGMDKLENLSKFNQNLNELEKISDFNKYQSMIFKGEKENEN